MVARTASFSPTSVSSPFSFVLRDRIEKKLDNNIDFIKLDNEYSRNSLNKKIVSSIISILMLCLSIVSMIIFLFY